MTTPFALNMIDPLQGCANDAQLGDIVFNATDDDGTRWFLTDIDGWWDLPDPAMSSDERIGTVDGGYDYEGRYAARLITLKGYFLPAYGTSVAVPRSRLMRAVNLVHKTDTLFVFEGPDKQADVRLSGKPTISTVNRAGLTQFEVGFRAADPRKYGTVSNQLSVALPTISGGRTYPRRYNLSYGKSGDSGKLLLTNAGDYITYPVITVYGPVTDPQIENVTTGEIIDTSITIANGEYLVIEPKNHLILLNATASRRSAIRPTTSWFGLVPGVNEISYNASSYNSSSRMYISYRSAWIS